MSRSRRPPPLFEVMRQTDPGKVPVQPSALPPASRPVQQAGGGVVDRSPSRPPVEVRPSEPERDRVRDRAAHEPAPKEGNSSAAEAADDDSVAPEWSARLRNLTGTHFVWMGVAVIAALIVVWSVGYWQGQEEEKQRLLAAVDSGSPPQPTESDRAAADPLAQPSGRKSENSGSPNKPADRPAAAASGDPRKPGLNYFTVQQVLHYSTAKLTADYMVANGVPAAAVPMGDKVVDTPELRANNRPVWKVIVAEGLDRKGYSSPRRTELETQTKLVGKKWARDPKGGFDFSSGFWDKYQP